MVLVHFLLDKDRDIDYIGGKWRVDMCQMKCCRKAKYIDGTTFSVPLKVLEKGQERFWALMKVYAKSGDALEEFEKAGLWLYTHRARFNLP